MKIAIILGTRPEVIKMSPIIRECKKKELTYFIIHTNQHYSTNMDKIFFNDLNLSQPEYNLNVGSGTHSEETGKMLIRIEKVLIKEKPDVVLVEGDTNTVIAGALSAAKLYIKVGHIESGLRSYDRKMPEELNRIITDHISDYLFAPTRKAEKNLLFEGIEKDKIFVTGNTIVDAVIKNLEIAKKKSKIFNKLQLSKKNYFLMTLHRQENVDTKDRLKSILDGLNWISKLFDYKIIYPIHPRTKKRIKEFGLEKKVDNIKNLSIIDPVGYLEFLQLEANAKLILTDSGGIQEESCILNVPCITFRDNTERPETLEIGSNILVGANPEDTLNGVKKMLENKHKWKNPFGDGKSGERIVEIISNYAIKDNG